MLTFGGDCLAEGCRIIVVLRRLTVHEIAGDTIELVGADFREALFDRLGSEADRRRALAVPVVLQALGKRHGTLLA